jgi:hypothetical protein
MTLLSDSCQAARRLLGKRPLSGMRSGGNYE